MAPRFEQTVKIWHLVVSLTVVVLGGAFTAGSAWSSITEKLGVAETKVDALAEVKVKADEVDAARWREIDRDLSTLKNDVSWIKQTLGGK